MSRYRSGPVDSIAFGALALAAGAVLFCIGGVILPLVIGLFVGLGRAYKALVDLVLTLIDELAGTEFRSSEVAGVAVGMAVGAFLVMLAYFVLLIGSQIEVFALLGCIGLAVGLLLQLLGALPADESAGGFLEGLTFWEDQ